VPQPLPATVGSPAFATLDPNAAEGGVRCGGLDFVRTQTSRTLGELVASSDDQLGFRQIAMTAARPWESLARIAFDVWTEARSGIGVAVPAGSALRPTGGACTATWAGGIVSLIVAGTGLPDRPGIEWSMAVQAATGQFEFDWAKEFAPYLQIDPASPMGAAHRTGWPAGQPQDLIGSGRAEVLPTRVRDPAGERDRSRGVTAITRHYPLPMTVPPDEATYLAWVSAVFASHLSTAPP